MDNIKNKYLVSYKNENSDLVLYKNENSELHSIFNNKFLEFLLHHFQ
jgi:hypothetical protein